MSQQSELRELPRVSVNYRTVVWVGIAVWAAALATLVIIQGVSDADVSDWVWVCVAGLGLGILARLYLMLPNSQARRT